MPSCKTGQSCGICQSTLVPYTPLSIEDQGRDGKDSHSCPSVEDTVMISSAVGTTRGLSKSPPPSGGSSSDAIRPGILDAARSSNAGRLSYLSQSYSSQGFSPEASNLMLASWRQHQLWLLFRSMDSLV